MTQPNDQWIEDMSSLLKEHARAQTMRDQWERKRVAVAQQIQAYRDGNAHNNLNPEPEQVPETDPAQG